MNLALSLVFQLIEPLLFVDGKGTRLPKISRRTAGTDMPPELGECIMKRNEGKIRTVGKRRSIENVERTAGAHSGTIIDGQLAHA
jgi:hypothetical protein